MQLPIKLFYSAFYCVSSHFLPFQYFFILLISFVVEVAGATVVLVYRASVSGSNRTNRRVSYSEEHSLVYWCIMCPSKADQYLNSMEDEVKKTIQDKYGENDSLTSLWNKTMDEVTT